MTKTSSPGSDHPRSDSKSFYDAVWNSPEATRREEKMLFLRQQAIDFSYQLLGELKGKELLEIGAGSGQQAVYLASQGAKVQVIDISTESLKAVSRLAEDNDVIINHQQMNAEALAFPAESFDLIYINSVLMHVNQEKVLPECSRVLKRGGHLVIVEPLQYAPFVQLYRWLSSYQKTKPRYATLTMFRNNRHYFREFMHQEFYLFSSALLPLVYTNSVLLRKLYIISSKIDSGLTKTFPSLRRLGWIAVVRYTK